MRFLLSLVLLSVVPAVSFCEEWNPKAAASYLDARAESWIARSRSRQELSTACVSCHTALPYMLSRSLLPEPQSAPAKTLFADVEARVAHWGSVKVWYDERRGTDKPSQSWATESVLNALVLAMRDSRSEGPVALTQETTNALEHMWARQDDDGSWQWLHFGLGPWETDGSDYWGSALAAVAAMLVAEELSPPTGASEKLRVYLRAGLASELSLHNRLALVWAASVWDGLLSDSEIHELVVDLLEAQRSDGGFRLVDLGSWASKDGTPPSQTSDGYATAFTAYVLQQVDDSRAYQPIARALDWLERNQKADGRWETLSPNKDRSEEEDFTRLLASDAATAFAVLALTSPKRAPAPTQPD